GLTELPQPMPAMIWYPYSNSEEFPMMGSAGRSATGGPVFRKADFPASDQRFPSYYEGKWLIVEFMRGWIMAVSMDENGDFTGMERFLPNEDFISAIDMQFSPDGDLYILEYGSAWFQGNDNALVKRVRYNGGNRAPVVSANADKIAGAVPLTVQLNADGTVDYDNDSLSYAWSVSGGSGFTARFDEPNPTVILEQPGKYVALLKVTDEHGKSNQYAFHITAGNEPPEVDIAITSGNESFFFPGSRIGYEINVSDREDGSVQEGSISANDVAINFDYTPEGFDLIEIAQNHRATDDWIGLSRGKSLIEGSDCFSCHKIDVESIGPSYLQVAQKYENNSENKTMLASRIINGSVGNWGEHAMSAHPNFTDEEAELMVDYILNLTDGQQTEKTYPLSGNFVTSVPEGQNGKGGYLLRAAYTDKGAGSLESLASEDIIALRNPVVKPQTADFEKGTVFLTTLSESFYLNEDGAYIGFSNLDLTGIDEIVIKAEAPTRENSAGGIIELRVGSPDGRLVGATENIEPVEIDFRAEMQRIIREWEAGGRKG
ncbi:MAG: PKD domain-containing protein, partial [Cyclobacteriaceae bacterium]